MKSPAFAAAVPFSKSTGRADEFPPLPNFKDDKKFPLSQETVRAMLKKTALPSHHDPATCSRHFHQPQGRQDDARWPDGRRLASWTRKWNFPKEHGEFIVPPRPSTKLTRLLQTPATWNSSRENQASFALRMTRVFPSCSSQAHRGQLSELPAGHSR